MTIFLTFLLRLMLVCLFFPFSALDKIVNFSGGCDQAQTLIKPRAPAACMILAGLAVEILAPLCILSGVADRAAALILALYCMATAILFKQFWAPGDFWHRGASKGRDLFWDFLKNFSLSAGILLITFGTGPASFQAFLANPLGSTHPYANAGAPP
jgi:putative oxidoreductase